MSGQKKRSNAMHLVSALFCVDWLALPVLGEQGEHWEDALRARSEKLESGLSAGYLAHLKFAESIIQCKIKVIKTNPDCKK